MILSEEPFMDNEKLFHLLISCFSDATMVFVFDLGLDDERNPEKIISGLAGLMTVVKNHHEYRHEFSARIQNPGESFESWFASLKSLTRFTKFESDCCSKCLDSRLLQQIIFGLHKQETRKTLLDVGPSLTLDQAYRIIQNFDLDQQVLLNQPDVRNDSNEGTKILTNYSTGNNDRSVVNNLDLSRSSAQQTGKFSFVPVERGETSQIVNSSSLINQVDIVKALNGSVNCKVSFSPENQSEAKLEQRMAQKRKQRTVKMLAKKKSAPTHANSIMNWIEMSKKSARSDSEREANRFFDNILNSSSVSCPPEKKSNLRRAPFKTVAKSEKKIVSSTTTSKSATRNKKTNLPTFKISTKSRTQLRSTLKVNVKGLLKKRLEKSRTKSVEIIEDGEEGLSKSTDTITESDLMTGQSTSFATDKVQSTKIILNKVDQPEKKTGLKRKSDFEAESKSRKMRSHVNTSTKNDSTQKNARASTPGSNSPSSAAVKLIKFGNRICDTQPTPTVVKRNVQETDAITNSNKKGKSFQWNLTSTSRNRSSVAVDNSQNTSLANDSKTTSVSSDSNIVFDIQIKPENSGFSCQTCNETFAAPKDRKDHKCAGPSQADLSGTCTVCEARQFSAHLDDNGRCRQCQGIL